MPLGRRRCAVAAGPVRNADVESLSRVPAAATKVDEGGGGGGSGADYWWPMSDGQIDCVPLKRRIAAVPGRQLRPRNLVPKQPIAPILPLGGPAKGGEQEAAGAVSRPLISSRRETHVFVIDGRHPEARGKILTKAPPPTPRRLACPVPAMFPASSSSNKAIYSYRIVNQRLSHVAAFSPPRSANSEGPQQIAYRFVFTNSI